VDFDDFTLVELEPGRGFYEVSRLLSMQEWRHRLLRLRHQSGERIEAARDRKPITVLGAKAKVPQ